MMLIFCRKPPKDDAIYAVALPDIDTLSNPLALLEWRSWFNIDPGQRTWHLVIWGKDGAEVKLYEIPTSEVKRLGLRPMDLCYYWPSPKKGKPKFIPVPMPIMGANRGHHDGVVAQEFPSGIMPTWYGDAKPDNYAKDPRVLGVLVSLIAPLLRGSQGAIAAHPGAGKSIALLLIAWSFYLARNDGYFKREFDKEEVNVLLGVKERRQEANPMGSLDFPYDPWDFRFFAPEVLGLEHSIKTAANAFEFAKRLSECGIDVFLGIDSITRLYSAINTMAQTYYPNASPSSGGLISQAEQTMAKLYSIIGVPMDPSMGAITGIGTVLRETGNKLYDSMVESFISWNILTWFLVRELARVLKYPAFMITSKPDKNNQRAPEFESKTRECEKTYAKATGCDPADASRKLGVLREFFGSNSESYVVWRPFINGVLELMDKTGSNPVQIVYPLIDPDNVRTTRARLTGLMRNGDGTASDAAVRDLTTMMEEAAGQLVSLPGVPTTSVINALRTAANTALEQLALYCAKDITAAKAVVDILVGKLQFLLSAGTGDKRETVKIAIAGVVKMILAIAGNNNAAAVDTALQSVEDELTNLVKIQAAPKSGSSKK